MNSLRYLFPLLLVLSSFVQVARSDETARAIDLLPKSTIAYLECHEPATLVDTLVNHPLRAKIESTPEFQAAQETPEYQIMLAGIQSIESHLEMKLPAAAKQLMQGGVYAAFDPESEGVVVLIQAKDAELLEKVRSTVVGFAKLAAAGGEKEIRETRYRDCKVYTVDQVKVAVMDQWLLATNKASLGKAVVDAFRDGREDSLTTNEEFMASWKNREESSAWGFINLAPIRAAGKAEKLFSGRAENPGVELLVGGLLDDLKHADTFAFSFSADVEKTQIQVAIPHSSEHVTEAREHFYGKKGSGRALPLVDGENSILSLSTYRDISRMWLYAGDLFDEQTLDEMAKADSNLSTLFGGKDFGEEILGALGPQLQLVVTDQKFAEDALKPTIQLPAFALIGELRDPDTMRPELRRTFQSLIGFLNVVGAQEGNPQLDMEIEKGESLQYVSGTYLKQDNVGEDDQVPIHYNFSPTAAFSGKRLVLASTKDLGLKLAKVPPAKANEKGGKTNTQMAINVTPLATALQRNKEHLISQNMLDEGNSREEAELAIAALFAVLAAIDDISFQFDVHQDQVTLDLSIAYQ